MKRQNHIAWMLLLLLALCLFAACTESSDDEAETARRLPQVQIATGDDTTPPKVEDGAFDRFFADAVFAPDDKKEEQDDVMLGKPTLGDLWADAFFPDEDIHTTQTDAVTAP